MSHAENRKRKATIIGSIALSAILLSGGACTAYNYYSTDDANTKVVQEEEDKNADYIEVVDKESGKTIRYKKDDSGDFEFEVDEGRNLDHLEDVALNHAENRHLAGRNLDHLERVALQYAEEKNKGNLLVRDDDGSLAFKEDTKDKGNLIASIDPTELGKKDKNTEISTEPEEPTVEEPSEPEQPTDPEKPVEPEPEPEPKPEPKPEPEPEPEEPVITTDISYKTDYLGFKVERIEDSTLEKGTEKVVQEGIAGNRTTKYKVTYKDGKEVSREVLEVNEKDPVNKIIHVGTKDLDELKALVNEVDEFMSDDYTEETWNVLLENLANAKNVLNDENSSQKQVDFAKDQLEIAIDSLVKAEEPETEEPEDETTDNNEEKEENFNG